MIFFKAKPKGNVSLTLVIVFTAVLISMGITLILTTVDYTFNSKVFNSNTVSKAKARSCIEDAISRIKANTSFTGSFTITFSDGNCTANVSNSPSPGIKNISVTGNYDSITYTETKKLDTNQLPFILSN